MTTGQFFDEQIHKEDRVGKEESSGLFLRSNKLLYELMKEKLADQRDAQLQGRPRAHASSAQWNRLLQAMGFIPACLTIAIDLAPEHYGSEYKPIIERLGFPERICERTVCQMAVCEVGAMGKPTIVIADGHGCDADHRYTTESLGAWFNIPTFYVDVPLNEDDKPYLADLNYIVNQLGEFIEWAESTVPGVKYDKDRHIELLELDAMAEKYRREIFQFIKHVPCPIPPRDMLRDRILREATYYPNVIKAVEYFRVCRDELGERVASGQGLFPERLRVLWAGQVHEFQAINPYRLLTERNVAVPLQFVGAKTRLSGLKCAPMGEVSEYGVKLSPLQQEARLLITSDWGGPGKRWVKWGLEAARATGAEGIICFNTIGCTPMVSMGSVVAEMAEKELGIPTLNLEVRIMDEDFMSQEKFDETLSAFIDKCFDWAGKPRQ